MQTIPPVWKLKSGGNTESLRCPFREPILNGIGLSSRAKSHTWRRRTLKTSVDRCHVPMPPLRQIFSRFCLPTVNTLFSFNDYQEDCLSLWTALHEMLRGCILNNSLFSARCPILFFSFFFFYFFLPFFFFFLLFETLSPNCSLVIVDEMSRLTKLSDLYLFKRKIIWNMISVSISFVFR